MSKNSKHKNKAIVTPNPLTLPFAFVALGTPATVQSSSENRKLWKAEVTESAKSAKPKNTHSIPWGRQVKAKIWYYFVGDPPDSDIDNIIKPIIDACNRVVYQDDRFVKEVCSHRVSIDAIKKSECTDSDLQKGFAYNADFVHILFEDAV